MAENKITAEDLRKKLDQLNLAFARDLKKRQVQLYIGAAAAVAAAVCVSYLLGKRRGRRP